MARTAFSVRFPAPLADALDDWAAARQSSRSDLVEALITATTGEDRDEILQVRASGAPTEKLNLRLSPAALAHLAQLAGDLPPADFLRRMVAAALGFAGQTPAESRGPSSAASSPRAGRRSRVRAVERDNSEDAEFHAPLIGVVVLVLIAALGIVIWLLVRVLAPASEPPAPSPDPDSRGQLDTGTPDGGGA